MFRYSLPCHPAERGIGCGGREIALATLLPGRKGDKGRIEQRTLRTSILPRTFDHVGARAPALDNINKTQLSVSDSKRNKKKQRSVSVPVSWKPLHYSFQTKSSPRQLHGLTKERLEGFMCSVWIRQENERARSADRSNQCSAKSRLSAFKQCVAEPLGGKIEISNLSNAA